MSLVGTRPILPDELEQYELHHRARIAIKPGITGMWQVSGRSDITDFEEIVRLDTEYISEWNIGLDQNPFEKGTLFLFCGRRSDRIKGLLWMGDGFLLLYKRLEDGSLTWPRTEQEAAELTEEQFQYLMLGLNPLDPKIKEVHPKRAL